MRAALLIATLLLAGCSSNEPVHVPAAETSAGPDPVVLEETCRQTARRAFDSLLADDSKAVADGQAEVDRGCLGVPAATRKVILDEERQGALDRDAAASASAAQ